MIKDLKAEIQFLQNQMIEVKDEAVDAIVEREKEIIMLKDYFLEKEEDFKAKIEVYSSDIAQLNYQIDNFENIPEYKKIIKEMNSIRVIKLNINRKN